MGHESRIELWSPNLTAFCFAGFGTDRLGCEKAMKTAGRENPNHWAKVSSNRAHGAADQNRSCSIKWAAKQEKVRPLQECFFLTFLFIELTRSQVRRWPSHGGARRLHIRSVTPAGRRTRDHRCRRLLLR